MARPEAIGPWRVERSIQEGRRGNANVFEVSRLGSAERFALKTPQRRPPSEPYQRFRDEVEFHRRYQDPGILPMLDGSAPEFLPRGDHAWLVMPLAVPFQEALSDSELVAVVDAIASVAETLARLAQLGVHHRDVKPQNLFVLDGSYVIGDFGLVAFPSKPEVTGSERHLGPIYYIAPEMISDPRDAAGEPADVYSLSKSLWVLATGVRVPTPGPLNVPQLALRHLARDNRAFLLEPLLEFATRFNPAERPSLAEMAAELRAWLPSAEAPEEVRLGQLEEATARISALIGPHRREEEEKLVRMRAANKAHSQLKAHLDVINTQLAAAIPLDGRYSSTVPPVDRFPQLGIAAPTYQLGWASIFNSPGKGVTLFGWIGVQVGASGVLRLAGAYALEPYEGTGRELVWSTSFDVLPGGAAETRAIESIREGLAAHLPAAVEAFADALQRRS